MSGNQNNWPVGVCLESHRHKFQTFYDAIVCIAIEKLDKRLSVSGSGAHHCPLDRTYPGHWW